MIICGYIHEYIYIYIYINIYIYRVAPVLQLQLHYTKYTALQLQQQLHYTLHPAVVGDVITAIVGKPQLKLTSGPSVDSLCHPFITAMRVSCSFLSLKLPPPPCAVLLVHM